jgi:cell division protein FtsB
MSSLLRQLGYLAAAALACFYVMTIVRGPNGLGTMIEKQKEIRSIQDENDELRREIQAKEEYIQRLKVNDEERERAIRERTNKLKPGEKIIIPGEPSR